MNFDWNEEQIQLRDAVIAFAKRDLESPTGEVPSDHAELREVWTRCGRFGLQGLNVASEFGGQDADLLTTIAALEALGFACSDNGLIFSLNAHMWAVQHPIAQYGSDALKKRYLPGLCDGSLVGAHAMSEPGAGSDALSLRTTATRDGDTFRLDGSKTFVTNAPIADVFVTFATVDRDAGTLGVTAFVVDRDAAGLEVGAPLEKMGLKNSPMGEVFFDGCVVPVENVLGRTRRGAQVFNDAMERERTMILASTVGSMERVLETSLDYARGREQFGRSIGSFQAVSHRLVEMKLRLETARLLLYRAGWLLDEGRSTDLEAALVKLYLSECYIASAVDAMTVQGGYGYMVEGGMEREARDAFGSRFYSGTSDMQRNLAARALGL